MPPAPPDGTRRCDRPPTPDLVGPDNPSRERRFARSRARPRSNVSRHRRDPPPRRPPPPPRHPAPNGRAPPRGRPPSPSPTAAGTGRPAPALRPPPPPLADGAHTPQLLTRLVPDYVHRQLDLLTPTRDRPSHVEIAPLVDSLLDRGSQAP